MKPTRILLLLICFGVLGISPARAERFTVAARIYCPASIVTTSVGDVADSNFRNFQLVPCAGVRVTALDSDTLIDGYCGSAYTNSRGEVRFAADCDDWGSRPDVYLEVESRSALGFSVGVHHLSFFEALGVGLKGIIGFPLSTPFAVYDYLVAHKTMAWSSAERLATEGAVLDYGENGIGGDFGATPTVSLAAAKQFWITQYSRLRFAAGTTARMMDFDYTVDAPFGAPTTLFDTVLVDEDSMIPATAHALEATPHEMGHVIYNTLHSDFGHWVVDGPDYMTSHSRCQDGHFMTLAWYEGFANFMRDYTFQRWDWATGDWTSNYRPFKGCAMTDAGNPIPGGSGLHLEGNIQGFLNAVYFGPVRADQRNAIGRITDADWVCPVGAPRVVVPGQPIRCSVNYVSSCPTGWLRRTDALSAFADECQNGVFPSPPTAPSQPICHFGGTLRRERGPDGCYGLVDATVPALGGSPRARPDGSPDSTLGRDLAGVRVLFSLPTLDTIMSWVQSEAWRSHRANEFWPQQIKPWCTRNLSSGTFEPYCDPTISASFKDEMRLISGDLR